MSLPEGLPDWVAHTPTKEKPEHWHLFTKHTREVAEWAREYASAFGAGELAYYLGLLHDLGKLKQEFQQYLFDCSRGIPRKPGSVPHKHTGAWAVIDAVGDEALGALLALPLHGHHGGMKACREFDGRVALREKTSRAEVTMLLERLAKITPELYPKLPSLEYLETITDYDLWIRMLYSCLVDADGLSTESHKNPKAAAVRRTTPVHELKQLSQLLTERQARDFAGASGTVNAVRRTVYEDCLKKATLPPGIFSLTVPTGGGKTRSSLAFALRHAEAHGLRQIVYAIPFTSIIDQTAKTFRELFGAVPGIVLEHHSAVRPIKAQSEDADDEAGQTERWRLLAAENWDAPITVTTTVQLFESLFSNRPGACRKLHRLAKSVIVLDEVQTLPLHLLKPIAAALETLVREFGTTVVLCTATQPKLDDPKWGFSQTPCEIITDTAAHFATLKRVHYEVRPEPMSWATVAEELREGESSCLCVVNTRKQAQALLATLDPKGADDTVRHLSTLLCGKHRQEVLTTVRARLKNHEPILLVSTTCIEAGVDVDFPKVLRAIGPLDRIIQAAGRCNREGNQTWEESKVIVFFPEDGKAPQGEYATALAITMNRFAEALRLGVPLDLDDPALVTQYFEQLYSDLDTDKKKIQQDREWLDYPSVAQKMRLIENDTITVFVWDYNDESRALRKDAEQRGIARRDWWRQASPYLVSLYPNDVTDSRDTDEITIPGLILWNGRYDPRHGIPLATDPLDYNPSDLMMDNGAVQRTKG